MPMHTSNQPSTRVLIAQGEGVHLAKRQDAIDWISRAAENPDCAGVIFPRETVVPAFFDLSSRIAGEILETFTQYGLRSAFVGDFSDGSESLRAFILESNKGKSVYFTSDLQDAIARLEGE